MQDILCHLQPMLCTRGNTVTIQTRAESGLTLVTGVASPPDVSMDSGLLQRVLGIDMTSFADALDDMQEEPPSVKFLPCRPGQPLSFAWVQGFQSTGACVRMDAPIEKNIHQALAIASLSLEV